MRWRLRVHAILAVQYCGILRCWCSISSIIAYTKSITIETAEQKKIALTPYDDKRVWHDVHTSEPYGLRSPLYQPDEVIERILTNCAKRVNITREKFLQLLDCTTNDFRKQIEKGLTLKAMGGIGCTFVNYGTVWNIDHKIPLANRNLKDEQVLQELCHFSNLQPMLVSENSRKKDKIGDVPKPPDPPDDLQVQSKKEMEIEVEPQNPRSLNFQQNLLPRKYRLHRLVTRLWVSSFNEVIPL